MTVNGWGDEATVEALRRALDEDIGAGDITTEACVPAELKARGVFIAREPLVVAGVRLLPLLYELRGGVEELDILKQDGMRCETDDLVARVRGPARTLLECERVALNYLQRLSGVATAASLFAWKAAGTGCTVLDTRKTTPGMRVLEKLASRAGGVMNHRMGLYDGVLIKNNHIAAAGGVRKAIESVRRLGYPVQVEVRTRAELLAALEAGAERLLLDNLTPDEASEWIDEVAGRAVVEVSGGVTIENVRAYAESGAHYVSSGAITHSSRSMDISFRLELE